MISFRVFVKDEATKTISSLIEETHKEYEKSIRNISETVEDFCKECVVEYHKVNKNISQEGSEQQLKPEVFEGLLKIDPKTVKRKTFTVKDERIFKSYKDGKCAGVITEHRDKEIGRNGGWKGRNLYYEGYTESGRRKDNDFKRQLEHFSINRIENSTVEKKEQAKEQRG